MTTTDLGWVRIDQSLADDAAWLVSWGPVAVDEHHSMAFADRDRAVAWIMVQFPGCDFNTIDLDHWYSEYEA